MKSTIASVFLLFFLFSTKSCLSGFNPVDLSPLTDSDGDELLPGVPYYIVSADEGTGGGVDLGWTENHRCPKFVMQHPSDDQLGTPVVLTLQDTRDCRIFEAITPLNISFVQPIDPLCRASTTWTLGRNSTEEKAWINTGGGGFGGWFIVYPARFNIKPNTYELAACYPADHDSSGITTKCNFFERIDFEGFKRFGFENFSDMWHLKFVKSSSLYKQVGGIKEAK